MSNNIKPIGTGDLLVVKQQIIGYEASEVAYIENILKGESNVREVRRSETVELTTTTETENTTEEERDLQTTERFELRRESEEVASTDGTLRSPAYGGLVEFTSSSSNPLQGSLQSSQQQASTYAKDVTNRAVSKITERARTEVVQRTVREFEEKTAHTFANEGGPGNVTGVYQWIDKVYQNQVYNYGARMLYDVMVPEPGAFLLQAFARAQYEGRELVKPQNFVYSPSQINEVNYGYLARVYEATGIEAPPPQYKTVSKSFSGTPAKMSGEPQMLELPLPDGYGALKGVVTFTTSPYSSAAPPPTSLDGPFPCVQMVVGDYGPFRADFYIYQSGGPFGPLQPKNGPLSQTFWFATTPVKLTGVLPIVVNTWYLISFALTINIYCQRTDDSLLAWQIRTHAILLQAYLRKKADYEERLANVLAAVRVGAIGQTTDQKQKLMHAELKKNCISIFTNQYYDGFVDINLVSQVDPVTGEVVPYAQIRLPDAEIHGKIIRFFEQAFEWEQVMHMLYSYFWARKDYWMSRVTIEDSDENFADFLKAGAARVVIPVRPSFKEAVIYFMEKGKVWEGGEIPEINNPLYLPILQELKEAENVAGTETPQGPSWKTHLPTTLVQLRADGQLPGWKEVGGEWVPV